MKYKELGEDRNKIPVIGQGCMGIGGYLSKDSFKNEDYVRSLRLGIDAGMSFIDTAEVYGNGHSEEIVGRAIEGIRDRVFIATKVSPENLSYDNLLRSAGSSLRRLKTDYIDLYQIHWPNPNIPLGDTMRAMARLLKMEKIRYIGVSNFSLKQLKGAQDELPGYKIVSIQVEYNLFDRSIERNIIPYCEEKHIITIAYSPLDQGRIASGDRKIKILYRIAGKYNKTIAQVALNWLVAHPSVVAIPKAVNPNHIRENACSADFSLQPEDFEELNSVFSMDRLYVPTDRIRVIVGGQGNRQVYTTLKEAMQNKMEFTPSPAALANDIRKGEVLKPVRVIPITDKSGQYDYDLIEGRIRYWAWVIAYGKEGKPIPVYIRGAKD